MYHHLPKTSNDTDDDFEPHENCDATREHHDQIINRISSFDDEESDSSTDE